jgi:hypothetical protein
MGCAGAVCGTEIGVLVSERFGEDGEDGEADTSVEVI